jgi:nicotinate-nucleotide pyrophosphorylase (carboxylating)
MIDAADVHPPRPAVAEAVTRALAEDVLPLGDLTAALVPATACGTLAFVARQPGVVAGQRCAEEAFAQTDERLEVAWHHGDGSAVTPGTVVAEVRGPLRAILTAERTALNFLGHLSGVATTTRAYVDAVTSVNPAVRVLDTRKTLPGLRALQKAAVRAGGGYNHRASLSDGVLVKDNHLGAIGITDAVAAARHRWPGRLVEVECDRAEQVEEAVRAGAGAVLLDNMTPEDAADCVALARRVAADRPVLVEVSGNITVARAPAYAASGVDLISVGALTHSVASLDLGLDLEPAVPQGG